MAYISYNRGFKSGGFDPTSTTAPLSFKPEVLDAYEVGLKSELLDRHLRINGAAFYYDYRDVQLNTYRNSVLVIYNGNSAKIYGLDLDVTAVPVRGLSLTAGLSLIHGRYGNFPVTRTVRDPVTGAVSVDPANPTVSADGKRLQNVPDYQINAGFDYHTPETKVGVFGFSADFFRSGKFYGEPENRFSQKAYSLVNASVSWFSDKNESVSVRLWGRNLGNVFYATQLVTQLPISDFIAGSEGRAFGVTAGLKF